MNSPKKPSTLTNTSTQHPRPSGTRQHPDPNAARTKSAAPPTPAGRPAAPPVYRPQPNAKLLQAKTAAPRQTPTPPSRPQPVAPPAYRPQPVPKVLQRKTAAPPHQTAGQTPRAPVAPPVYRPQPVPVVLQRKAAGHRPAAQPQRSPAAPPVYRPEPKKILQTKMAPAAPPRRTPPAPHGRVIQRAIELSDGTVLSGASGENMEKVQADYQKVFGTELSGAGTKTVISQLIKKDTKKLTELFSSEAQSSKKSQEEEELKQLSGMHGQLMEMAQSKSNDTNRQRILNGQNGCLVLFRAVTYHQAMKILNQQTFGGAPRNDNAKLPSEDQIKTQIGRGKKTTGSGAVEEWTTSLDIANAFGKDTLVLVALVHSSKVVVTDSTESGVIGDAGLPLEEVAIYSINNKVSTSKLFNAC